MRHRVVVTGLGCVTPIGLTARDSFANLLKGRIGIKNILNISAYNHLHSCLAEAGTPFVAPILEIDPKTSDLKTPRSHIFATLAAEEAINDSGLKNLTNTGIYFGTGLPELDGLNKTFSKLSLQGYRRISPYFIPSILGNSPAAHLSRKFKLKGPLSSPSLACSTGSFAIGDAFRLLRDPENDCDSIIAGATETPINIPTIYGFSRLRALCSDRSLNPQNASRPFDADRCGFVLGEGAGCVILERLDSAAKRDARIYAEIIGFGSFSDGFDHRTAPDPSNSGAEKAIKAALFPSTNGYDIVSINAHATSTVLGDEIELAALEKCISNPSSVSVVSNKSSLGHLLGASGAVESIFSILSLHHSQIPSNLNLESKIPTRFILPTEITKVTVPNAAILKSSFGFGGVNVALLFKKFQL